MKDKKAVDFEILVRQELSELYDYAYGTPKTPENATDLALAQSYYEDLREELRREFFENPVENLDESEVLDKGISARKMRKRVGSLALSAKKFIDGIGGKAKATIASIEIAQSSLEEELLAVRGVRLDGFMAKIDRRDGSRKKALVNTDRQTEFKVGAVNFPERAQDRFEHVAGRRRKSAYKLGIRAKRVS